MLTNVIDKKANDPAHNVPFFSLENGFRTSETRGGLSAKTRK